MWLPSKLLQSWKWNQVKDKANACSHSKTTLLWIRHLEVWSPMWCMSRRKRWTPYTWIFMFIRSMHAGMNISPEDAYLMQPRRTEFFQGLCLHFFNIFHAKYNLPKPPGSPPEQQGRSVTKIHCTSPSKQIWSSLPEFQVSAILPPSLTWKSDLLLQGARNI